MLLASTGRLAVQINTKGRNTAEGRYTQALWLEQTAMPAFVSLEINSDSLRRLIIEKRLVVEELRNTNRASKEIIRRAVLDGQKHSNDSA